MANLSYGSQLRHPNWQRRRLEIMQRDEFRCQSCMSSELTLHVHHKRYVKGRMAWEYSDDELVTVCEFCHEDLHQLTEEFRELAARLPVDGPGCLRDATALIAGWASASCGLDGGQFHESGPFSFRSGEVIARIENASWGNGGTAVLEQLRDLLYSSDRDAVSRAVAAMIRSLKEG